MKTAIGSEQYQHYTTEDLLHAYSQGYPRLTVAIRGLSLEELRAKPLNDKWSILEIVLHLCDAELVGACRFRFVLAGQKETLPFYKQDELAVELRYQAQSEVAMYEALNLFNLARRTTLNLFSQCTSADWNKSGLHPKRGEMTLRALLELYADHSERHIEQILERRVLLGKPIALGLILKDRLY